MALEDLRNGDARRAVRWYARNGRLHTHPDRLTHAGRRRCRVGQHVDAGHDSRLLAWRRRDVADLNRLARNRWHNAGRLHGPEIEAPSGRRFAAGDLVVLLEPDHEQRLVASEGAVIAAVDPPPHRDASHY